MSTPVETPTSPFSRPGFLISAAVVVLIAVLGIGLAVGATMSGAEEPAAGERTAAPTTTPSISPTPTATSDETASVCGLRGEVLGQESMPVPPEAEWSYQDLLAYPISPEYGPAAEAQGYRYCFQHSPEGALLMAANTVIQFWGGTTPEHVEYLLAAGEFREQMLENLAPTASDTRLRIRGFRLLEYNGREALIDIAASMTDQGQEVPVAFTYALTWSDGDWKISTATDMPFRFSSIPNFGGFIPWND